MDYRGTRGQREGTWPEVSGQLATEARNGSAGAVKHIQVIIIPAFHTALETS